MSSKNPPRISAKMQAYLGTLCCYCGRLMDETPHGRPTIDHVIPRSMGGIGSGEIVVCCSECNRARGNRTVEAFLAHCARVAQYNTQEKNA